MNLESASISNSQGTSSQLSSSLGSSPIGSSVENNNSSEVSIQNNISPQTFTLRESVEVAMANYFSQLEDEQPVDLYNLVLAEVEAPLMESVMKFTRGNQTKASEVLGLNRGTLRKKLKTYGLN